MWEPGPFPKEAMKRVQRLSGNSNCMDCGQPETSWGGPTYGILLCVKCAGRHRSLGTHITVIKSLSMDRWDAGQVRRMELGGNGQLRSWFKKCQTENSALEMKYRTKAATLYRENLRIAAEEDLASEEVERGGQEGRRRRRRRTGGETTRSPERAPVVGKGRIFEAAERAAAADLAREKAEADALAKQHEGRSKENRRRRRKSGGEGGSATPAEPRESPTSLGLGEGAMSGSGMEEYARRCGKEDEYEVVFGPGGMGFTLMKDAVSRALVTRLAPGGTAFRLGVRTGDYLVGVEGNRLHDYDQLMLLLPRAPRPLRLLFEGAGAALAAPPSSFSSAPAPSSAAGRSRTDHAIGDGHSSDSSTASSSSSSSSSSGSSSGSQTSGSRTSGRASSSSNTSSGEESAGPARGLAGGGNIGDGEKNTVSPVPTPRKVDVSHAADSPRSPITKKDGRMVANEGEELARDGQERVNNAVSASKGFVNNGDIATVGNGRATSASAAGDADGVAQAGHAARVGVSDRQVDDANGESGPDSDASPNGRMPQAAKTASRTQQKTPPKSEGQHQRLSPSSPGDSSAKAAATTEKVEEGGGGEKERTPAAAAAVEDAGVAAVEKRGVESSGACVADGRRDAEGKDAVQGAQREVGSGGGNEAASSSGGRRRSKKSGGSSLERKKESEASSSPAAEKYEVELTVGSKVTVQDKKKGSKWRKGLLRRRHGDGSWTVRYSGGMEERRVVAGRMRLRAAEGVSSPAAAPIPAAGVTGTTATGPSPPPPAASASMREQEEGHRRSRKAKKGKEKAPAATAAVAAEAADAVSGAGKERRRRSSKRRESQAVQDGDSVRNGDHKAAASAPLAWAAADGARDKHEEFRAPGELKDDFFADSGSSDDDDDDDESGGLGGSALTAYSRPDPSAAAAAAAAATTAPTAFAQPAAFSSGYSVPRRMEGFGGGGSGGGGRPGGGGGGGGATARGAPRGSAELPAQSRGHTVVFPEGGMGLTLTKEHSGGCSVTRVVPGGVAHSRGVAVGHRVCAVNGQPSGTYEHTMAVIAGSQRPLSITFALPVGGNGGGGRYSGVGGGPPSAQHSWADVGLAATISAMDAANAVAVEWGLGNSTPGVLDKVQSAADRVPPPPQGFRVHQKHSLMAIPTGVAGGFGNSLARHRTFQVDVSPDMPAMSTKKALSDAPGEDEGEFDVKFGDGELGMRLEERGSFQTSSVVVKITEGGQAMSLGIRQGCTVVGINGEKYLSHAHTVATLKHAKRPVAVRFRAPDAAGGGGGGRRR